jgi:hypothetical protein
MSTVVPVVDDDAIFDASSYDLPIPKLDGHKADRLTLSFGGSIELDWRDEENLELIERLHLGEDVGLHVTTTVAGKGFSHTAKAEDGESVGYQIRLRVHSLK